MDFKESLKILNLKYLGEGVASFKGKVRSAYRKLAKKNHPDLGGDEQSFRLLREAYEFLLAFDPKNLNSPSEISADFYLWWDFISSNPSFTFEMMYDALGPNLTEPDKRRLNSFCDIGNAAGFLYFTKSFLGDPSVEVYFIPPKMTFIRFLYRASTASPRFFDPKDRLIIREKFIEELRAQNIKF